MGELHPFRNEIKLKQIINIQIVNTNTYEKDRKYHRSKCYRKR